MDIELSPWEIAQQETACEHRVTEIRYKLDRAGRRMYCNQCLDCGEQVGVYLRYDCIPEPGRVTLFDEQLQTFYRRQKTARYRELIEARQDRQHSEFWTDYNEYLSSPEWLRKRQVVLKRDNYLCQACLQRRATQVHHLSYAHLYHEPLFDLVAICQECHDELTRQDRERRQGNGQ